MCIRDSLGLAAFNELANGFVNDRQVYIAVMGILLRSVMACFTLVWRLSMNMAMVSLTICRLILGLWVYRYDQLCHAVPWAVSYTHLIVNETIAKFIESRQTKVHHVITDRNDIPITAMSTCLSLTKPLPSSLKAAGPRYCMS